MQCVRYAERRCDKRDCVNAPVQADGEETVRDRRTPRGTPCKGGGALTPTHGLYFKEGLANANYCNRSTDG